MERSVIDDLYEEYGKLVEYLGKQGEVSFQVQAADNFRKTLLLSAASYFEHVFTTNLIKFFEEETNGSMLVTNFIQNKALTRQYHQLFDWSSKNANRFYSLFGNEFKTFMEDFVRSDKQYAQAVASFLEIGDGRNTLAHGNFAAYVLEKTPEEIYELYQNAKYFIDVFPLKLREFAKHSKERGISPFNDIPLNT
jgi:hypothetical protein